MIEGGYARYAGGRATVRDPLSDQKIYGDVIEAAGAVAWLANNEPMVRITGVGAVFCSRIAAERTRPDDFYSEISLHGLSMFCRGKHADTKLGKGQMGSLEVRALEDGGTDTLKSRIHVLQADDAQAPHGLRLTAEYRRTSNDTSAQEVTSEGSRIIVSRCDLTDVFRVWTEMFAGKLPTAPGYDILIKDELDPPDVIDIVKSL